jgi:2-polyprenyl-3-methyl-5-hydroxy-6-metoxy-1,4-benzoquinol methylase
MNDMGDTVGYIGTELEVFTHATNWRAYWQAQIQPYLGQTVLEVGAGIGTITKSLGAGDRRRWVALEPDLAMAERLRADRVAGLLPDACEIHRGGLDILPDVEIFESILYIDVLEHIENDRDEVRHACEHLCPGGYLIILVPAHQSLYSPFDRAIGHFRRYDMKGLLDLRPVGMSLARARYLDSVGLLASLGNKLLLKSAQPALRQILLWDRAMVRASRVVDPLLRYRYGKSLLVIWKKNGEIGEASGVDILNPAPPRGEGRE